MGFRRSLGDSAYQGLQEFKIFRSLAKAIGLVQSLQGPERADPLRRRQRLVADDALQFRREFLHLPIHDGLPCEMALSRVLAAQFGEEFIAGKFHEVRHFERFYALVLHAPDAAPFLVPLGMIPRDFVVRDDLVVPIHEIFVSLLAISAQTLLPAAIWAVP